MQKASNNAHKLTLLIFNNSLTEGTISYPLLSFTGISRISFVYKVQSFSILQLLFCGSQEIRASLRKPFFIQSQVFDLLRMCCI